MYVQDIALPSGSDRNKERINRMPDYSSQSSIKSSLSGNRQECNVVDSQLTKDGSGELEGAYNFLQICFLCAVLMQL